MSPINGFTAGPRRMREIKAKVLEILSQHPAVLYERLVCLAWPGGPGADNRDRLDEILEELDARGVISWHSGEITLQNQPECAAFGSSPETATLQKPKLRARIQRAPRGSAATESNNQ